MSPLLRNLLIGGSVRSRALRSSAMTILDVGGGNLLRLASNLILTRLLFPEAFGLMSLMQIFIFGLQTFSDIGINTMLIQHRRGGHRRYLDTLWTLQILRGLLLWALACLIAWPASRLYDQPEILTMLPVLGISLAIAGFTTTKEVEANRELQLGRVVVVGLTAKALGLIAMALAAWILQSVWALILGTLFSALLRVFLMHAFLHGQSNRLRWDPPIVMEALRFGSFIFLSTICSFFILQGSQMILAANIDIALFGIFSIALLFGTLPGTVMNALASSVIFPLYRLKSPTEGPGNQANLFKARRLAAVMGMAMSATLSVISVPLINLLYDERYALAGPMMAFIAAVSVPGRTFVGAQEALNGHGDSRRNFYLNALTAGVQMAGAVWGVQQYGVLGAVLAAPVAVLVTYPLRARFISHYNSWDPRGDACLYGLGAVTVLALLWFNAPALVELRKLIPAS